jgi:hypothetical protein
MSYESYNDLKLFFSKELPATAGNDFIQYSDVTAEARRNIELIEKEVERIGVRIKKSQVAAAAKARLIQLKKVILGDENYRKP